MKKRIDVVGAQLDVGASKRGVSMGPLAIRFAGLCEGISDLGYDVNDKGDIIQLATGADRPGLRHYEQVIDVGRKLYELVTGTLRTDGFPVVLGGDHSIAAGTIAATAKYYKSIGIIWMDAHGDWNNEESTLSGNMHGMPFSAVCGGGPAEMVDFGQDPVFVDPAKCVQIGGRDIDPAERIRLRESGVTVFSIDRIDRMGMEAVMDEAIRIAGTGTAGIHLSFDVDAITPESAPGTGTIVHSGLTVREAFLGVEMLSASKKLIAVDMVEVNPILDEKNRTGILASELVLAALGKVVY
ncbi:MAG TPA: arginase [Anaerovoracaceae bacterium]|nr:arginase [Bacillota bacterium]HRV33526.1 arginase [Anaerovoracaceae bacterium]